MKRIRKVRTQNHEERHFRWAFQTLVLSINLSIIFGFLSQTVLSRLGTVMAIIGICAFIFISVVFDMFGIAVTSAEESFFLSARKEGVVGASAGLHLCENSEKVCSFCADVIGDICSTLCGAGGACIVVSITKNIHSSSLILIISTLVSALIAGLTIFFKALMKQYAITNANKLILKAGRFIERKTIRKKRKNIDKNS